MKSDQTHAKTSTTTKTDLFDSLSFDIVSNMPTAPIPTDPVELVKMWNENMVPLGYGPIDTAENLIAEIRRARAIVHGLVSKLNDTVNPCPHCGLKVRQNFDQFAVRVKLSGIVNQLASCVDLIESNHKSYLWENSAAIFGEIAERDAAPAHD